MSKGRKGKAKHNAKKGGYATTTDTVLELQFRERVLARKALTCASRAITHEMIRLKDEIIRRHGVERLRKIKAEVDAL